jgi:hypothetical protein
MTILLVRVEWMPAYMGETKVTEPISRWVQEGNLPGERSNFLRRDDGNFYGYLRPAAGGEVIRLGNFGADKDAVSVNGITIVFVSPRPGPSPRPLVVAGYYRNATVYRDEMDLSSLGENENNIRIVSDSAISIPPEERNFEVILEEKWGSGGYRFLEEKDATDVIAYLDAIGEATEQDDLAELATEVGSEGRVRRASLRFERRSNVELRAVMLQTHGDYKCECCGLGLPADTHPAMRKSFEVHHKAPFSKLQDGEFRKIFKNDLAVVCANCHRGIHAAEDFRYVQDMAAFRRDVLNLKD